LQAARQVSGSFGGFVATGFRYYGRNFAVDSLDVQMLPKSEVIVKKYAAIFLLFCILGCGPGPNRIEYVIPNGFRGTVRIIHKEEAPELPIINGCYVYTIPEDGVLFFGGYDPLVSHLRTARFANGDSIWVSRRIHDHPEGGQVGLFGGSTHREWGGRPNENDGKLMPKGLPEYHVFIGTEEQWKSGFR
jgi:hypothetical protein